MCLFCRNVAREARSYAEYRLYHRSAIVPTQEESTSFTLFLFDGSEAHGARDYDKYMSLAIIPPARVLHIRVAFIRREQGRTIEMCDNTCATRARILHVGSWKGGSQSKEARYIQSVYGGTCPIIYWSKHDNHCVAGGRGMYSRHGCCDCCVSIASDFVLVEVQKAFSQESGYHVEIIRFSWRSLKV